MSLNPAQVPLSPAAPVFQALLLWARGASALGEAPGTASWLHADPAAGACLALELSAAWSWYPFPPKLSLASGSVRDASGSETVAMPDPCLLSKKRNIPPPSWCTDHPHRALGPGGGGLRGCHQGGHSNPQGRRGEGPDCPACIPPSPAAPYILLLSVSNRERLQKTVTTFHLRLRQS